MRSFSPKFLVLLMPPSGDGESEGRIQSIRIQTTNIKVAFRSEMRGHCTHARTHTEGMRNGSRETETTSGVNFTLSPGNTREERKKEKHKTVTRQRKAMRTYSQRFLIWPWGGNKALLLLLLKPRRRRERERRGILKPSSISSAKSGRHSEQCLMLFIFFPKVRACARVVNRVRPCVP